MANTLPQEEPQPVRRALLDPGSLPRAVGLRYRAGHVDAIQSQSRLRRRRLLYQRAVPAIVGHREYGKTYRTQGQRPDLELQLFSCFPIAVTVFVIYKLRVTVKISSRMNLVEKRESKKMAQVPIILNCLNLLFISRPTGSRSAFSSPILSSCWCHR